MRKSTIKVGDQLCYYAEGNSPGELYTGPFPARVTVVHEPTKEKPGEPQQQKVDLVVKFSAAREHVKTQVLVTENATKHCCSELPREYEGYTYENWYEKLEEKARLAAEAAAATADKVRKQEEAALAARGDKPAEAAKNVDAAAAKLKPEPDAG